MILFAGIFAFCVGFLAGCMFFYVGCKQFIIMISEEELIKIKKHLDTSHKRLKEGFDKMKVARNWRNG